MGKVQLIIQETDGSGKFEAMLNPGSLSHGHSISYSDKGCKKDSAQGSTSPKNKFEAYGSETLDFELMLDGTGAVPTPSGGTVSAQIISLKSLVYDYSGTIHEPKIVDIIWGTLDFQGRLSTLKLDYSLLKPDGEPLRAKITLGFSGFMTIAEQAAEAKNSSPDLTHIIEFKAGDTLPLLCHKIYKDSSYHVEVAEHNQLDNFRHITPGTRLYFPPLV